VTSLRTGGRDPDTLEHVPGDDEPAPVLLGTVEARLSEAAVLVFLMARPVAKDRASAVHLYLTNRPTVAIDLEVPDHASNSSPRDSSQRRRKKRTPMAANRRSTCAHI
jgi:hypothetical protein